MVETFDISNLYYLSISINSLKYQRSTTLGYKNKEIRKLEFVAKSQLLCPANGTKNNSTNLTTI